ncbi:MAG: hypothetical protein KBT34_00755 [Prevotella sp.]|nr:hypothetical protein [Candidatus Prevotella equi]
MDISNDTRKALMERVKNVSGLPMLVRGDFDELSTRIKRQTGMLVSSTTLRRFFGYQENNGSNSLGTLNIICQYVGYRDIMVFSDTLEKEHDSNPSEFMESIKILASKDLNRGDRLRIVWAPNRSMVVRYEGGGEVFTVEECTKGKLQAGDSFHCHQFVLGEPLYCKFVLRQGLPPIDYVCGRNGGIRFEVLKNT